MVLVGSLKGSTFRAQRIITLLYHFIAIISISLDIFIRRHNRPLIASAVMKIANHFAWKIRRIDDSPIFFRNQIRLRHCRSRDQSEIIRWE